MQAAPPISSYRGKRAPSSLPTTHPAFADAALRLIVDDLLRARMSRVARAVAEHRSWDAINLRIAQALAEVIG